MKWWKQIKEAIIGQSAKGIPVSEIRQTVHTTLPETGTGFNTWMSIVDHELIQIQKEH